MGRPPICRKLACEVAVSYFKPQGIPLRELEEIALELDEVEALRLADIEGLYQADAALRMGVSRQTFGKIIARAHQKVARALLHGKALRILNPREGIDILEASTPSDQST
ncbi:MAG: hypothetical protein H6R19_1908 [Proteobacteria bacterium]|nr:hypothetical protein [Pseudomonadota bacterium]